jgi:hypothetical protein
MQAGRVAARHEEGGGGEVDGVDARVRPLRGQGERDAAAARAHVDDEGRRAIADQLQRRLHQQLRFRRGMRTSGGDDEVVLPEGLMAGEVLERAAARALVRWPPRKSAPRARVRARTRA